MSEDLYQTRVYFDGSSSGCVKIPGVYRRIGKPPVIPGLPKLEAIDYAPAVNVFDLQPWQGGRREMLIGERACVVEWLDQVKAGLA